jgi:hypothetical protein
MTQGKLRVHTVRTSHPATGLAMNSVLITALRESHGYLQDQGWHQTARLMTVAAEEIERLNARLYQLEDGRRLEQVRSGRKVRRIGTTLADGPEHPSQS